MSNLLAPSGAFLTSTLSFFLLYFHLEFYMFLSCLFLRYMTYEACNSFGVLTSNLILHITVPAVDYAGCF